VVVTTTVVRVDVSWTQTRLEHIATRGQRYPDAVDIDGAWATEAAADPHARTSDPDPRSRTGAVRIVGYSPMAGFVITVIAARVDGELWGVTAWKTTGAERRAYQEAHDDEPY
jgi:hypothetical protein